MNKKIDLSIIIVSYNTKELLKQCLLSIRESHVDYNYEIIVVDNNSSDGTLEDLKALMDENITTVINKENLGFSKANNLGVNKAQGSYVLFLNSDTKVNKGTLSGMLEFMERSEKAGASTCKVVLPSGKLDDGSHRGFPTPWNAFCYFSGLAKIFPNSMFFNGYNLGWKDLEKTHEIDSLMGAFMLVRRSAGDQVNWWDEDYFWNGEDIDFCFRLKEKGWKIYYVPAFEILHYKGASAGIKKTSQKVSSATLETKIQSTNARFEAMKIFYKKHYGKKYSKLLTFLIFLAIDIKKLRAKVGHYI